MKSNLKSTINATSLAEYVARQLNNFFPDDQLIIRGDLELLMPEVSQRLEHCFAHVNNRYFFDGESVVFNHLHADQYSMFLYLLSRVAFETNAGNNLPSKAFLLNKSLHGIDAFFEVELPSVFLFVHPLGTVLGRGNYSDYLVAYQRCGIGSNHDIYPNLGKYLTLHPGSSILGRCTIGDNVAMATDSLIIDKDLASGSQYIGNPKNHFVRHMHRLPNIWRQTG